MRIELEHYEKIEGEGPRARRQGQQALPDDPGQPARCHAGHGRGAALRGLRPASQAGPHLEVRRHGRPLRGGGVRGHGLGWALRPRESLKKSVTTRPGASRSEALGYAVARRSPTPPTRTAAPAASTSARDLPDGDLLLRARHRAGQRRIRDRRGLRTSRPRARAPTARPQGDASMSRCPFYVSPEQVMADKAEYARKGIARGKSSITIEYQGGVADDGRERLEPLEDRRDLRSHRLLRASASSASSISSGRSGVRYADMKGYAVQHARTCGPEGPGECLLPGDRRRLHPRAQAARGGDHRGRGRRSRAGRATSATRIYRVQYDGSISDHKDFCVIGGSVGGGDRIPAERTIARPTLAPGGGGCAWDGEALQRASAER